MTIVLAPAATFVRRGRPLRCAAALSDQPPPASSRELEKFALRIGAKATWIRKTGGPSEHVPLYGRWIEVARDAGAIRIDRFQLVAIVQEKRSAIDAQILFHRCGIEP